MQCLVRKRGVAASLAPTLALGGHVCSSRARAGLSVRVMKRGPILRGFCDDVGQFVYGSVGEVPQW